MKTEQQVPFGLRMRQLVGASLPRLIKMKFLTLIFVFLTNGLTRP